MSTTAEFTNIIETSPLVDQTSYTAQTKTYPTAPCSGVFAPSTQATTR